MSCKILLSLIMVAPMSDSMIHLVIHRCWELLHVFDVIKLLYLLLN